MKSVYVEVLVEKTCLVKEIRKYEVDRNFDHNEYMEFININKPDYEVSFNFHIADSVNDLLSNNANHKVCKFYNKITYDEYSLNDVITLILFHEKKNDVKTKEEDIINNFETYLEAYNFELVREIK
jgi:hypothetical protein